MVKEKILWKADPVHTGWYILKLMDNLRFEDFLKDVLSRRDNQGAIYIQGTDLEGKTKNVSLTYGYGLVTWTSDESINRINDYIVVSGQADGFPTEVNYHITIKRGTL